MAHFTIREARSEDIPHILQFIRELADYEKLLPEVVATEADLKKCLFCTPPRAFVLMAEYDNQPIGFVLYFYNFSTFMARHGIYIEDLYIQQKYRGMGYGKQLLQHVARKAADEGCGRVEWWVLDWNKPALEFYHKLGAEPMKEWTVQRLSGAALEKLADNN